MGRTLRTWSALGELGRRPTEYEVVTHKMNHTLRQPPLELSPDAHGNLWLRKYRDGMRLQVADWDGFHDPDELTYHTYVRAQDESETFIDGLLSEFATLPAQDPSGTALELLQTCCTPTRYLAHGLQMLSGYLQQLAPSSYIGNCAAFQTADHLRRIQRIAYRTRQLALAHPEGGFGTTERRTWELHPQWQAIRRGIELLLVVYDWDDAFVGLNLVVKPLCDELTLRQFASVAREAGATFDALLADNLFLDAQRSQRWSVALCRFLIAAQADNRTHLMTSLRKWHALGTDIVTTGSHLLGEFSRARGTQDIAAATEAAWLDFLFRAELVTPSHETDGTDHAAVNQRSA